MNIPDRISSDGWREFGLPVVSLLPMTISEGRIALLVVVVVIVAAP